MSRLSSVTTLLKLQAGTNECFHLTLGSALTLHRVHVSSHVIPCSQAPVEVVLELRLEWSKEDFAGDFKKKLESHLQSWCNNNVDKSGCTVVSVEGDRAVVKIKSAAGAVWKGGLHS